MTKISIRTEDNIFQVAASYLGDATQWIRIAVLNQIDDPFLGGMTDLLLPDVDTTAGGGIVRQ